MQNNCLATQTYMYNCTVTETRQNSNITRRIICKQTKDLDITSHVYTGV